MHAARQNTATFPLAVLLGGPLAPQRDRAAESLECALLRPTPRLGPGTCERPERARSICRENVAGSDG